MKNPRPDNESAIKLQRAVASMDFAVSLEAIPWEFFATLTFAGTLPKPSIAYSQAFKWLQKIADIHRRPYNLLLLALRGEQGEQNGRFHFHALVGGTTTRNYISSQHMMEHFWKVDNRGARVEVRRYDPSLRGASYITKGVKNGTFSGANRYELMKYNNYADSVTLSDSVLRFIAARDSQGQRLPLGTHS